MAQTNRAAWGYRPTCHHSAGVACVDMGLSPRSRVFHTARPHRDREPVTPSRNGAPAAVAATGDTHV